MFAFFLTSGLFLGWSLGANNTSNVFGTAVGSGMMRFKTAAIYCSVFVILGAVISGAGATQTLGKLGSINAIAGAFVVALGSAVSVYLMTKAGLPVSTSQAIVGAIFGWNLFSGSLTDYDSMVKILSTWVICPVLSAAFAMILYKLVVFCISSSHIHMFALDAYTRYGLLIVGIFGSYALGANNIATVTGIFVPVSPLADIDILDLVTLSAPQQLFLIGGLAIAAGVFTYSKRVIMTVGRGIMELSPVMAFVAVLSHSIVLFVFASEGIERFLLIHGLPTIPLVPVSSSQAIVGAVIGIGLLKGGKGIRWRTVGGIVIGWVATPVLAALICFISLFFFQNVFQQKTYRPVAYIFTSEAVERIQSVGIPTKDIKELIGNEFASAVKLESVLSKRISPTRKELDFIIKSFEVSNITVNKEILDRVKIGWITAGQKKAVEEMDGRVFTHNWQLEEALANASPEWRLKKGNKKYNEDLKDKLAYIHKLLRSDSGS